jgi:hypothetical protein
MKMKRNGVKNLDSRSKYSRRTSIAKSPIEPCRIRKITGSFAFIEHRFLREGFLASLNHHQLLLYLFLIIVADRHGLSYYSYDKICTLLGILVDEYILARNVLIDLDLIAFDGSLFQVLSLPDKTVLPPSAALNNQKEMEQHDPATIHHLIMQSFGKNHDRNCQ